MSEEETINEESINEEAEWQELKQDSDYEININYPHQIRKKSNGKILKESANKKGYLMVSIHGKSYRKHRIVAIQWIDNPLNLPIVDHINHNRIDNRIENLRWVSNLQNSNNKGHSSAGRQIEYVSELPENSVVIEQYDGRFEFKGVYFHGDLFYVETGNGDFRIKPTYMNKGRRSTTLRDIYGIQRTILYNKFLKEYGLD